MRYQHHINPWAQPRMANGSLAMLWEILSQPEISIFFTTTARSWSSVLKPLRAGNPGDRSPLVNDWAKWFWGGCVRGIRARGSTGFKCMNPTAGHQHLRGLRAQLFSVFELKFLPSNLCKREGPLVHLRWSCKSPGDVRLWKNWKGYKNNPFFLSSERPEKVEQPRNTQGQK